MLTSREIGGILTEPSGESPREMNKAIVNQLCVLIKGNKILKKIKFPLDKRKLLWQAKQAVARETKDSEMYLEN